MWALDAGGDRPCGLRYLDALLGSEKAKRVQATDRLLAQVCQEETEASGQRRALFQAPEGVGLAQVCSPSWPRLGSGTLHAEALGSPLGGNRASAGGEGEAGGFGKGRAGRA